MPKQNAVDKAIESLEAERAIIQACIDRLAAQRSQPRAPRAPRKARAKKEGPTT